ncbi:MAG: hypothetical protein AAGF30_06125 [Pseudomonadota bacterium]
MAKQDDWIRITLRLPQELHARISSSGGASSLNATIVQALEDQFPQAADERYHALLAELDELMASDNPHKDKLAQLYDWGAKILDREREAEKRRAK